MKKTPLHIIDDVAAGKVSGVPSHWIASPTLHDCPNCGRLAGSVCVPKKWRPWGKPCAARIKQAQKFVAEWFASREVAA